MVVILEPLVLQLLTRDSYSISSQSISTVLTAKTKVGFIDGTITRPDYADPKSLPRKDATIYMVLDLNSLSKEVTYSIIFVDFAKEIGKIIKISSLKAKDEEFIDSRS